ncbi:MAG: 30S ribosomal protein S15 [Bacilli bacterium]|jgi:small subunit ribosomal protein S15|nr:30S ribosomal protein S15 [Bacilli bacterium]MCH4210308.1 30S ribosomal protein S15 [Bacilli bacterium]MCH4228715.1 30S ribosomal protein S15 [Bacilli bacterium]MCI2054798.1 30S ribosomal protein S15 [Bacilli bacterium]
MALKKEEINVIVKKYGKNEKDTGSAEVQIALLSKRIAELTEHLKSNGEDANARRSLLILVGKRHSLLDYLAASDHARYEKLIATLGIRK